MGGFFGCYNKYACTGMQQKGSLPPYQEKSDPSATETGCAALPQPNLTTTAELLSRHSLMLKTKERGVSIHEEVFDRSDGDPYDRMYS